MEADDSARKNGVEVIHGEVVDEVMIPPAKGGISNASKRITAGDEEKRARKVKRLRKKQTQTSDSPLIKYGSLFLLVAQLVGLVMLMRYSRTHTNGQDLYLSSTAVFCMEVRIGADRILNSIHSHHADVSTADELLT